MAIVQTLEIDLFNPDQIPDAVAVRIARLLLANPPAMRLLMQGISEHCFSCGAPGTPLPMAVESPDMLLEDCLQCVPCHRHWRRSERR